MESEPFTSLFSDSKDRATLRRNSGMVVGGLTLLIAAAVFFFELHLSAAPTEQTAVTALVMLLCCFVMYTSLYDTGHAHASEQADYRKIQEEYEDLCAKVRERSDPASLERFCSSYVEAELYESRYRLLLSAGVEMSLFSEWQAGTVTEDRYQALPREKQKALVQAGRLKPLQVSAYRLLGGARVGERHLPLSVAPRRAGRTAFALIPTLLGCLVTVSVSVSGVTMSAAVVVLGLLRLFTILWSGVRGYGAGKQSILLDDTVVLRAKCTLLSAYLYEGVDDM